MSKSKNAGGDWFNAGKKPGAYNDAFGGRSTSTVEQAEAAPSTTGAPVVEQAIEKPVAPAPSGQDAKGASTTETVLTDKPAEVVEAKKDEQSPSGEQSSNSNNTKDNTGGQAIAPPAKRVIKAEGSALIEIPGHKPKSAEAIAFELKQGQNLQRKQNELDHRERVLREREERLMSGVVEKPTAETAPKHATVETDDDPRPVRPKDSIPGDPEYDQWLVDEIAWNVRQSTKQVTNVLTARDREAQERQSKAQQTFEANRQSWSQALDTYLPFDYRSLPDETRAEAFDRINGVAQRVLGIDLRSEAHMSQQQMSQQQFGLLIAAAFPEGSMAPGYVAEESVDDTAVERLRQTADKPIVQGEKPQPLHDTMTGTVAPARKDERPAPKNAWHAPWKQPTVSA